ncbi:MAG: hypothetical protein MUF45_02370 [Spirosomaceae bacterium]|jgi:hypothetical protein|nr:hypothetical protein [Spirosomataceae bacterium]
MKKLFLMLFWSISVSLFAQSEQAPKKWNQSIEMYYPENTKVSVVATITPVLLKADQINIDSLVRIALKKYKEVEEETDEVNAKTVVYSLGLNDKNWIYTQNNTKDGIEVSIHKPTKKMYGFLENGEVVSLKNQKDTLMINLIYGDVTMDVFPNHLRDRISKEKIEYGNQLSFGFVVNDLKQLESLDYGLIRQDIKNAIQKIKDKVQMPALAKDLTMPISIIKKEGSMNMNWYYQRADVISITGAIGAGWVRAKPVPSIDLNLNLDLGKIGVGVGAMMMYDFKNLTNNTLKVSTGTFLNAHLRFNKFESKFPTSRFSEISNQSSISLGYLVKDKTDLFNKSTWRTAISIPLFRHLLLEPEIYFNGAFKNLYPALRLKVN